MPIASKSEIRTLRFLFFTLVVLLPGCTVPQSDLTGAVTCVRLRTLFVVSHGWHTGIIVERKDLTEKVTGLERDFGDARFLEIGWGDERFYRAATFKTLLALRAVLWPTSGVLHVAEVPDLPRRAFPASEVVELSVPRSGYQRLLGFVASSFRRPSGNSILKLEHGIYGRSAFYAAEGAFHAFNTCNTWVARAIRATGYPISTATITADGLMSQLDPSSHQDAPCYMAK